MQPRIGVIGGPEVYDITSLQSPECLTIPGPRVALSSATLECRLDQIVTLASGHDFLAVGTVTGVHIRDEYLTDGYFDIAKARPMARLGDKDYAVVTEPPPLDRPD